MGNKYVDTETPTDRPIETLVKSVADVNAKHGKHSKGVLDSGIPERDVAKGKTGLDSGIPERKK